MASTADIIAYRNETIFGFEQKNSYFRATVTPDVVIKGNIATFLVADTIGVQAVTRGRNGMIPARSDNFNQPAVTLTEWHDKPQRTGFDIFSGQGNGRQILQAGTTKVLNRKIDDLIITDLSTATHTTGAAATASLSMFAKAKAILGNNDVDVEEEENMFCAISPAAEAYLLQVKEYANAQYVDMKPLVGPALRMRRWMGLNWFISNRLSGRTTTSEKLLMYHRAAIGYAANTGEMEVKSGENEENQYFWARASLFMGAKLLQNSGVVVIPHDGSAYA